MYTERSHPRHQVLIGSKLIIRADEMMIIDCDVANLSDGGAQVTMACDYTLPPKIYLLEEHSQNIFECDVRWQTQRTAGLMFIDLCSKTARKALIAECSSGIIVEASKEEVEAAKLADAATNETDEKQADVKG